MVVAEYNRGFAAYHRVRDRLLRLLRQIWGARFQSHRLFPLHVRRSLEYVLLCWKYMTVLKFISR